MGLNINDALKNSYNYFVTGKSVDGLAKAKDNALLKVQFFEDLAKELSQELATQIYAKEEGEDACLFINQLKENIDYLHQHHLLDQTIYKKSLSILDNCLKAIEEDIPLNHEIQKAISHHLISPNEKQLINLKASPQIKKSFAELQKLRLEKQINPQLVKNNQHLLARKIAKAQFAYGIGVKPILSSKGIHGAMFMPSVTGKEQGVFKLPSNDSYKRQVVTRVKLSQKSLLNEGEYAEVCAEKAAYMIAEKLNCPFLTAVPTTITSFTNQEAKTKEGAFLLFCKAKLAEDVKNKIEKKEYTPEELNRFQIFAIFDYLIGNLDRHAENWMVKIRKKDGTIKKIIPIDNANILPKQEPNLLNIDARKNQYGWKSFNISNHPFTNEVKEFIKKIDHQFVDEVIDQINQDEAIASLYKNNQNNTEAEPNKSKFFLSTESKERMKKRVDIIRKVLEDRISTPQQLAQYSDKKRTSWLSWLFG